MSKTDNAYDIVKRLFEQKKTRISENALNEYEDGKIAIAILKEKYNAKYHAPACDDCYGDWSCGNCCGTWTFDNPLLQKQTYYCLSYCYFSSDKWKDCTMVKASDKNCCRIGREVLRLDMNSFGEKYQNDFYSQKKIFDKILKEKIFVGYQRYWRITLKEDY